MIENLLSKLEKVTPNGIGRWVACCPGHPDKTPSLGITETGDGRILIHCFSTCPALQVLSAIGLTFDDLYPQKLEGAPFKKSERRPFSTQQIIGAFQIELLIGVQLLGGFARGTLVEKDRKLAGETASNLARFAGEIN
jgi:hypothetical protein